MNLSRNAHYCTCNERPPRSMQVAAVVFLPLHCCRTSLEDIGSVCRFTPIETNRKRAITAIYPLKRWPAHQFRTPTNRFRLRPQRSATSERPPSSAPCSAFSSDSSSVDEKGGGAVGAGLFPAVAIRIPASHSVLASPTSSAPSKPMPSPPPLAGAASCPSPSAAAAAALPFGPGKEPSTPAHTEAEEGSWR